MPSPPTKKEIAKLIQQTYMDIENTICHHGTPVIVHVQYTYEREHSYISIN